MTDDELHLRQTLGNQSYQGSAQYLARMNELTDVLFDGIVKSKTVETYVIEALTDVVLFDDSTCSFKRDEYLSRHSS